MSNLPKILPLKRFLHHVCIEKHPDRRFCFILGSGASVESGIKTGATLVNEWMAVIEQNHTTEELQQWKKDANIDDDDLAASYANIFDKRFELDKTIGFFELEKAMEHIEPSCGYSVLAHILANSDNNMVITTNFDSLTEDALFIYTQKKPLVVSHEALAQYINPKSKRPAIIKIHRDLLLDPKNSNDEVHTLADGFKTKLQDILKDYTPIVIGYGGNDGSLMGLLEDVKQIPNGMFWCYRPENSDEPNNHALNDRITTLVKQHKGYLIPIPGFDSLMIQMGDQFGYGRFDGELVNIANGRADEYRKQIENLTGDEQTNEDTKSAISNITAKGEKDWLYYKQLASAATDDEEKEKIYLSGIEALKEQQSYRLIRIYADFLDNAKKDYSSAEQQYLKSLSIKPDDSLTKNNYATLLFSKFNRYDEARKLYLSALELDPNNNIFMTNYANLFQYIDKDYDNSERYYLKAIANDADSAHTYRNYAVLLSDIRQNYQKADEHFNKALKIDPDSSMTNCVFAKHLIVQNKLIDAKKFIQTAFELNGGQNQKLSLILHFYNYACFAEEYPDAKTFVENLLDEKVTYPGLYLDNVIAVAESLNHPELEEVKRLAEQISKVTFK